MFGTVLPRFLLALACLQFVAGYEATDKIPNGNRVTNPCNGETWFGLLHQDPAGFGPKNPFGKDFETRGGVWKNVCSMDSDGDGRTNGEELGDPHCTWTRGDVPPKSSSLSHPGICEPLNNTNCAAKNSWLKCQEEIHCPAKNQPDVRSIDLRFTQTTVSEAEYTYICQGFYLPNDTDYHIVAITPLIDNEEFVHHILLISCLPGYSDHFYQSPGTCTYPCSDFVGIWTYGSKGECVSDSDKYGFHFGKTGSSYFILQKFFSNPDHKSNAVDSSGVTLYYTPKLRKYDAGRLLVGAMDIFIPPGQQSFRISGTCHSNCTRQLPTGIYVSSVHLRTHLLGKAGRIDVIRDGHRIPLVPETHFTYESRIYQKISPVVPFYPGDEIVTTCFYESLDRNNITMRGRRLSDEMCWAFLTYYPLIPGSLTCTENDSKQICQTDEPGLSPPTIRAPCPETAIPTNVTHSTQKPNYFNVLFFIGGILLGLSLPVIGFIAYRCCFSDRKKKFFADNLREKHPSENAPDLAPGLKKTVDVTGGKF